MTLRPPPHSTPLNKEAISDRSPLSGRVLWLMGPTSSGKSTLAEYFLEQWRSAGELVVHYDGDEVRDFFGEAHGFDPKDRLRVVKTLTLLANKAAEAGLLCIVSALTAHADARAHIHQNIHSLVIGHVNCSIEECARRDPKGLYALAKKGEVDTLIGWNSPYEPPSDPSIVLDTQSHQPHVLFKQVDTFLRNT